MEERKPRPLRHLFFTCIPPPPHPIRENACLVRQCNPRATVEAPTRERNALRLHLGSNITGSSEGVRDGLGSKVSDTYIIFMTRSMGGGHVRVDESAWLQIIPSEQPRVGWFDELSNLSFVVVSVWCLLVGIFVAVHFSWLSTPQMKIYLGPCIFSVGRDGCGG